jgi:thioredoxin 1
MDDDTTQPEFSEVNIAEVVEYREPLMMEIRAEWCGSCHIMAPVIEKLKQEYNGKIEFVKMDIETKEQVAREYGVTNLPILLFFSSGQLVDHIIGIAPRAAIAEKLDMLLQS